MKKIGDYTLRGLFTDGEGVLVRIATLFDGRFDTAYRLVKARFIPSDFATSTAPDCLAKLSTDVGVNVESSGFFDCSDNREIAWGGFSGSTDGSLSAIDVGTVIDPDNMIVEDLYMAIRQSASGDVNYILEFEKYDITDWQGALSLVRNRSQG
jgi:hypothetical protein